MLPQPPAGGGPNMRTAVFVAPFFAETTVRFIEAAATLPGVRLGLVSQDPLERLPRRIASRLAGHFRVGDGMDGEQIRDALLALGRGGLGPVERVVGALEPLQEVLAGVRRELGIPGMLPEAAENFRDKNRMKDVLRRHGLPCARHGQATSAGDAIEIAARIGYPLVAKPPAGAGARNTLRVESPTELGDYVRLLPPSPARPLLLEEFVVGEEHSFDAVTLNGRTVWHSLTHYRPGPLEVMREPWIQWTVLLPREVDHPRYDDIREVGGRALSVLGMRTGLSHMEWFRRPDGTIAVSEVAARPPGAQFTTLISYAHDVDFYRVWARLVVREEFEPLARQYAAGIAFLRGQGRGRVRAIHGLERAQRELGPLVVETRLPRPGTLPSGSYEGEGYVVLRHPDTATVARGLAHLVSLVRVEMAP